MRQRPDGGWGEDEESYAGAPPGDATSAEHAITDRLGFAGPDGRRRGGWPGGRARHRLPGRGHAAATDGEWDEEPYTAVGFPRVFYLRYHGYRLFFPLLAMARYRNLMARNSSRVSFGF